MPLTTKLTQPLTRKLTDRGSGVLNLVLPPAWQTNNLNASTFTQVAADACNYISDGTSTTCAYKALNVVPGNTYLFTFDALRVGTSFSPLVRMGDTIGSPNYVNFAVTSTTGASSSFSFTPIGTPVYMACGLGSATAEVHATKLKVVKTATGTAVAAWGDSLTVGSGSSNQNTTSYVPVAKALFAPAKIIVNYGVTGDTSTQIKTRQLASLYTRELTNWIWAGRNDTPDFSGTKANIDAMIANLSHSRYLVASVMPSAADSAPIIASNHTINATLASAYGSKFVDLVTPLQAANDGTANDLADVAAGFIPRSKRSDSVHLNDAGYAIVAQVMHDAHVANGYA